MHKFTIRTHVHVRWRVHVHVRWQTVHSIALHADVASTSK
jgi:hypothetical protein